MADIRDTTEHFIGRNQIVTEKLDPSRVREISKRDEKQVVQNKNFWRIALTVVEFDVQVVINVSGPVTLGRITAENEGTTFIDFSPYRAHTHGVSRTHATLTLHDDKIVIQDNKSSNGTYLNDQMLRPSSIYPLRRGDTIALGKLVLQFNILYNPFQ